MRKAVESAANWLAAHSKHNPIPYPLFKSIITKQIEWADKKGIRLDFAKLADAVRAELQKSGIRVTSEGNDRQSKPLFEDTDAGAREKSPLC